MRSAGSTGKGLFMERDGRSVLGAELIFFYWHSEIFAAVREQKSGEKDVTIGFLTF